MERCTAYLSREPVYLSGSVRRDLPGVSMLGGDGPRSLRLCSCSVGMVWVATGAILIILWGPMEVGG